MSWAWSGPLGLAAASAVVCAVLASAVRRETGRLRAATVQLRELRKTTERSER